MPAQNPYNCAKPGNLFVGYEEVRIQLIQGLRDGNSYAILGGQHCGKTSLLLQLAQDLQANGLLPFRPLPRFLDIQEFNYLTPELLFEKVYGLVIQDVHAVSWVAGTAGRAYQDFLAHLDAVKPLLDTQHGPDWLVILLIDELDAAVGRLANDHFFQNLRHLLMISRFRSHFRLIASSVQEMIPLITSDASPLNNLRIKYLRNLTATEMHQLITHAFPQGLPPAIAATLEQMTGKHPYLLQGLLEKLWIHWDMLDEQALDVAARAFIREHRDFQRWLEAFGPAEHAVYQCLSEAREGMLHIHDLRQKIEASLRPAIDDALSVLSYHGVIDDSELARPRLAGTLFRDWYRHNGPQDVAITPVASTLRLFCSYAHEDEAMRDALVRHLASLEHEGIIAVWHDRRIGAGEEWQGKIAAQLEAANIVLFLVSADFFHSDYCRAVEIPRALARHTAGEALVIPLIIRPVLWEHAPFARLQVLPANATPVSKWANPEEAWVDIVRGIRRAVEQWRQR